MKQKRNKLLSVLLCMAMLLSFVPMAAATYHAATEPTEEASKFISEEDAKQIALKDAGLDKAAQKIVFTKVELNRNQGKPCYLLEFYTGTNQYFYQIDAKTGAVIFAQKYILLSDAKKIALEDSGCTDKVIFTEETLVDGGIKSPYYRLVFASAKTQWMYRIDAVLGIIMEKQQEEIGALFISEEDAKQIALKDAGLDKAAQKIVFTKVELNRNQGKPCYLLEFYTGTNQYFYQIDAKTGAVIFAQKYILLSDAKKIALEDSGCTDKVIFTEETLVDGGIKSPYYRLVFASAKTQWMYRIDAVLGIIMEKKQKEIHETPDMPWENPFGDVKDRDWFYASVKFAYESGLMKGISDAEFSPDADVTRAMFVTILYRIEKEPQAGSSVFIDITGGSYYAQAVAWASANGIISGVSKDRFAPNEPITREQMAAILYRYASFKGYDTKASENAAYPDEGAISDYAKEAIRWAADKSLMTGNANGSFAPKSNATRAQAAAVFMRMLELAK